MAIDRERILIAAQKYVEKKRYDRAALEYQKVLQEDPNDARILLKLGDLQSKMEAYADAVATYERVGKFYAAQGFALKAIAVFKQIREIISKHVPKLDDRYAHILPQLAELYRQLGLTSDALAALDEVATRLQRLNRDAEAINVFGRIVELDPTNPLPHLRLAEAMSRVRNVEGAVVEFGVASGQLLKLGRRDDALKVIERLLVHRPDALHARIAAELYLSRGGSNDGLQALSKLQICFQANPRDLDTLALLARAFTQIGQAGKAVEVQKEMARIARDSGKTELFSELVAKLRKLAPNDEGVRELVANPMPPPQVEPPSEAPPPPPPSSQGSQGSHRTRAHSIPSPEPEWEEAYEDVGDVEIEAEEVVPTGLGAAAPPQRPEVGRILADAAGLRREKHYARAIQTLRAGTRALPRSVELRELLRDVLLDAGEPAAAVAEMVVLAELLIEALDGESAARSLQDALAIDPENPLATRMLNDLGYELVDEALAGSPESLGGPGEMRPGPSYDPEAPLPSYDLEEIGPEDVAARSYSEGSLRAHAVTGGAAAAPQPVLYARGMDAIDDPFEDAPLPSFPFDPTSERIQVGGDFGRLGPDGRRGSARPPRGVPELEAALEEADFFASRGLLDDARTILQEQLVRLPNHPLLRDRLAELDAQEHAIGGGSGTRPSPAAAGSGGRHYEGVESLQAFEIEPSSRRAAAFAQPTEQVDVEEVFAKFKAGVAQQIGVDDSQSHYDLGVAYKEMALFDDAIREFDTAAREAKRACVCHSMIGMIQLERGNLNEAIDAFLRGLQSPERTKEQEAVLSYELGAAYEAKKLTKQALEQFQRAARLSPTYRDVQERIRRLQKPEAKAPPSRAVAVGADDEFDRAFDDMLGEDKRK